MRHTRVFILRLLIDLNQGHALRGSIQPVPDAGSVSFSDEAGLLAELRRLVAAPQPAPQPAAEPAGQAEAPPGANTAAGDESDPAAERE